MDSADSHASAVLRQGHDLVAPPRLSDRAVAMMLLLAYAALRLLLVRATRFNSDEPQHAHVAWGWSQGLVPYRDVFDNHMPLFHMLFAPVVRLVGETPDLLLWLRVAIVPVSVLALGLAFLIARHLWNRRVAAWAVMLAAVFPPYLYVAGEFRTDVLWGTAWMGVVAVAVVGGWSNRRAFALGLLLGVAWAVSLKTSLLTAGLAVAWLVVLLGLPAARRPSPRTMAWGALLIVAGACVVPLLVIGVVAAKGGLAAMRYGVLTHNLLPGLGAGYPLSRIPRLLGLLALLVVALLPLRAGASPLQARRSLVLASAAVYGLLLVGGWPLLTRQDDLPVIPLLAIGLAGWWDGLRVPARTWVPAVLAGAGLATVFTRQAPLEDHTAAYRKTLAEVLAITSRGDAVMDDKGASIYRRRPFHYALETITLERLRRGLIPDDIARHLVASETHVVWASRLPPPDRAFVARNYVEAPGGLHVAGFDLGELVPDRVCSLQLLLPGAYVLLGGDGGRVDGVPCDRSCRLEAGLHALSVSRPGHYRLVWQPAAALFGTPSRL